MKPAARPKRRLVSDSSVRLWKRPKVEPFDADGPKSDSPPVVLSMGTEHGALNVPVARLQETRDDGSVVRVAEIYLNEQLMIGRRQNIDLRIEDLSISGLHCRLSAICAGTEDGGVLLCCEIVGKTGVVRNGQKLSKGTAVMLLHDDILEFRGAKTTHKFACLHLTAEEATRRPPNKRLAHSLSQSVIGKGIETPGIVRSRKPHLKIDEKFIVEEHILGAGSNATVRLATAMTGTRYGKQVACKSIVLPPEEFGRKEIMKEVEILQKLRHPNINGILYSQAEAGYLHVFLELCQGGDMHSWLSAQTTSSETKSRYLSYQLMLGLEYLHQKNIAHRDLKPENILIQTPASFPRILIADFGFSRSVDRLGNLAVCGTPSYMPPEAIRAILHGTGGKNGKAVDFVKADCWSVGAIVWQMLTLSRLFDSGDYPESESYSSTNNSGRPRRSHGGRKVTVDEAPYPALPSDMSDIKVDQGLARRILKAQIPWDDRMWNKMPAAKRLVGRLLTPDPSKRSTMASALASSWIKNDALLEDRYATHVKDKWDDEHGDGMPVGESLEVEEMLG